MKTIGSCRNVGVIKFDPFRLYIIFHEFQGHDLVVLIALCSRWSCDLIISRPIVSAIVKVWNPDKGSNSSSSNRIVFETVHTLYFLLELN